MTMSFNITLDEHIIGLSRSVAKEGEQVQVQVAAAFGPRDTDGLLATLEMISAQLLNRIQGARPQESQIDSLVAIIRKDWTATIHVNPTVTAQVQVKGQVQAQHPVTRSQIADVTKVEFPGIELSEGDGVVVLLSHGWKRAAMFDLSPLHGSEATKADRRAMLVWTWLAAAFDERMRIDTAELATLTSEGWFPFVALQDDLLAEIVGHVREKWDFTKLRPRILKAADEALSRIRARLDRDGNLAGHKDVVGRALDHFVAGDYLSASTMLYPRIEGVLHEWHRTFGTGPHKQGPLAVTAVTDAKGTRSPVSLLEPELFKEWLEKVYFANFDAKAPAGVGRHSISHGLAPAAELDWNAAVKGVLMLDHLFFLHPT